MEPTQLLGKIGKNSRKILSNLIAPYLSSKKDTKILHKLYSYPAKFQGRLPEVLIKTLTKKNDTILDAFSGGGTTSVEALLQGRNSYAMDLNPISVVVSKAKTLKLMKIEFDDLLKSVDRLKPLNQISFLNESEEVLMGKNLSSFCSSVISLIRGNNNQNWVYLLATVLIKRIKLSTRRDKKHLRIASFEKHIEYILMEIEKVKVEMSKVRSDSKNLIEYGSNHDIPLKDNSVDLIITSPPYPNIDIEYNLIQIQRRDLRKCFRSDVAQRLCEEILRTPISPTKKDLCSGGLNRNDYWKNAELSLREIKRVLKIEKLCFLYIGFKIKEDKKLYEDIIRKCNFKLLSCFPVELGKDRVASSRGLYHGKETKMMKQDYLYVLR